MTTMHCGVALRGLMALIQERGNRGFVETAGVALSDSEALAWVQGELNKGLKFTSGCPTPLPDGQCPGHAKEREA